MAKLPTHNPECSDSSGVTSGCRSDTIKHYHIRHKKLIAWVNKMARLCEPDEIVWIDGSDEQKKKLEEEAITGGELIPLNQAKLPDCFLHRTSIDDVARTEHLTFICTKRKRDAGSTNNWMSPGLAYRKAKAIFKGAMRARTMYVIPFSMGPFGSSIPIISICSANQCSLLAK